jgi:hypothetical protein
MSRILRVPASVLILALLFSAAAVLADEAMLPVDVDSDSGRVLLEIRSFDEPLIYTNTLAKGLGTPPPLLGRGDTGHSALVVFERHGDRVLLIRDNPTYRAISDDEAKLESMRGVVEGNLGRTRQDAASATTTYIANRTHHRR